MVQVDQVVKDVDILGGSGGPYTSGSLRVQTGQYGLVVLAVQIQEGWEAYTKSCLNKYIPT